MPVPRGLAKSRSTVAHRRRHRAWDGDASRWSAHSRSPGVWFGYDSPDLVGKEHQHRCCVTLVVLMLVMAFVIKNVTAKLISVVIIGGAGVRCLDTAIVASGC